MKKLIFILIAALLIIAAGGFFIVYSILKIPNNLNPSLNKSQSPQDPSYTIQNSSNSSSGAGSGGGGGGSGSGSEPSQDSSYLVQNSQDQTPPYQNPEPFIPSGSGSGVNTIEEALNPPYAINKAF